MARKTKKTATRPASPRRSRQNGQLELLVGRNTIVAVQDESYKIVVQVVDELLADPEIRELIRRYTRELFQAIARKC